MVAAHYFLFQRIMTLSLTSNIPHKLTISVKQLQEGWGVTANEKPVKTPMQKALLLPSEKLARAVAKEWEGSNVKITKHSMPLTSIACIALDLVSETRAGVIDDILPYADTDMLCYRAGDVPKLHERQAVLLDPIVDYASKTLDIHLVITDSVMPATQPYQNRITIRKLLESWDIWHIALLSFLAKPLSSFVLALAVVNEQVTAENAFMLSHLEETYETEQWGSDAEKDAKIAATQAEILAAGKFLALL